MPTTLKDDRGSTSLFFLIVFLTLADPVLSRLTAWLNHPAGA